MDKGRRREDVTLLDVLIDGFEKNEILDGFHWRDLPMPDEDAAVRKFASLSQQALYKLTAILEADGLPYAIIGALALNEYGHRRVTVGVDLVMRDEHLPEFKRRHLGEDYAERVPGSGKLLDVKLGVNIDVLST